MDYYVVATSHPFNINKYMVKFAVHESFDSLVAAQYFQCKLKIEYYTNRLEHTAKKNRKELRKKIAHLKKRRKAYREAYPEELL